MRMLSHLFVGIGLTCLTAAQFSENAQGLFDESMEWMDAFYDSKAGYLYDLDGNQALRHNTRSSSFYAVGLLARNEGEDASEAEKIILNLIGGQFTDPEKQWYGTYQKYPEEPTVGIEDYPPSLYGTYDPNWRGFVATGFILMIEEFGSLLSDETQDAMLDSLVHAAVGDSYRVGGVDGDNLYPAYSNPALMRAVSSGWTGRRVGDANLTTAGEDYAQEIIDLFNMTDTLSEFNSATYTGVSLFALVLWAKYMPEDSVMGVWGPRMIEKTWASVAELWNPSIRNIAGPWDRTYGYDMNRYIGVMGPWLWTLIGKEESGFISTPQVMGHSADWAWSPSIAVLAEYSESLLPDDLSERLSTFQGEHTYKAQAYAPPTDTTLRNITTWVSERLMIGAQSFRQTQGGGPTVDRSSFNPMVIHWLRDNDAVGFIALYPSESAMNIEVSPNNVCITYTDGSSESEFSFVVSPFLDTPVLQSWEDVPGVTVSVSGNANLEYTSAFGGSYAGKYGTIRDFEHWRFEFLMPEGFEGQPEICLEVQVDG